MKKAAPSFCAASTLSGSQNWAGKLLNNFQARFKTQTNISCCYFMAKRAKDWSSLHWHMVYTEQVGWKITAKSRSVIVFVTGSIWSTDICSSFRATLDTERASCYAHDGLFCLKYLSYGNGVCGSTDGIRFFDHCRDTGWVQWNSENRLQKELHKMMCI